MNNKPGQNGWSKMIQGFPSKYSPKKFFIEVVKRCPSKIQNVASKNLQITYSTTTSGSIFTRANPQIVQWCNKIYEYEVLIMPKPIQNQSKQQKSWHHLFHKLLDGANRSDFPGQCAFHLHAQGIESYFMYLDTLLKDKMTSGRAHLGHICLARRAVFTGYDDLCSIERQKGISCQTRT